jgi:hypothetical protein
VTARQFRKIALGMTGVAEGAHMGHPDFRVNGKIFATLYPDGHNGMVKLTPEQQSDFVNAHPAFQPASGAWGRQGCTTVILEAADADSVGEAMTLAWQNVAARLGGGAASTKPRRTKYTRTRLRTSGTSNLRRREPVGERPPKPRKRRSGT